MYVGHFIRIRGSQNDAWVDDQPIQLICTVDPSSVLHPELLAPEGDDDRSIHFPAKWNARSPCSWMLAQGATTWTSQSAVGCIV